MRLEEDDRFLRHGVAEFARVLGVISSDRQDAVGAGDRRIQRGIGRQGHVVAHREQGDAQRQVGIQQRVEHRRRTVREHPREAQQATVFEDRDHLAGTGDEGIFHGSEGLRAQPFPADEETFRGAPQVVEIGFRELFVRAENECRDIAYAGGVRRIVERQDGIGMAFRADRFLEGVGVEADRGADCPEHGDVLDIGALQPVGPVDGGVPRALERGVDRPRVFGSEQCGVGAHEPRARFGEFHRLVVAETIETVLRAGGVPERLGSGIRRRTVEVRWEQFGADPFELQPELPLQRFGLEQTDPAPGAQVIVVQGDVVAANPRTEGENAGHKADCTRAGRRR